jgi:hypothetical protein
MDFLAQNGVTTMQDRLNGTHIAESNGKLVPNNVMVVEVFSIEEGQTVFARMLDDQSFGMWTHWSGRSTVACKQHFDSCTWCKKEKVWKGYLPIEIWMPIAKVWIPWVLEMSERLEQDFRGLLERGQTWEIFRHAPTSKHKAPQQAKLHESHDPKTLPPAFDITPVLLNLFHLGKLPPHIKNPLPQRVLMQPSSGEGPSILKPTEKDKVLTAEEMRTMREEWERKKKSPTMKEKNGTN